MTAVPSECELMDLSHEICSMWENVGIRLGLKKSTLGNIAGTPSLDTPQKKAFEMLIKWRQLQTTPSHAQLVSALELEGREDLGQKYSTYQQVRYVWYVFEWWSLHRLHIEFVSGISSKRPFMVDMLRIQQFQASHVQCFREEVNTTEGQVPWSEVLSGLAWDETVCIQRLGGHAARGKL